MCAIGMGALNCLGASSSDGIRKGHLAIRAPKDMRSDNSKIYNKILPQLPLFIEMKEKVITGITAALTKQTNRCIGYFGCGQGHILEDCAKYGKVIGYDNDEEMIEYARKNIRSDRIQVRMVDYTDLNLNNTLFDSVVISNTLYLHDAKMRILKEISESIKDGGTIIITGPKKEFDLQKIRKLGGEEVIQKDILKNSVDDFNFHLEMNNVHQNSHIKYPFSGNIYERMLQSLGIDVLESGDLYHGYGGYIIGIKIPKANSLVPFLESSFDFCKTDCRKEVEGFSFNVVRNAEEFAEVARLRFDAFCYDGLLKYPKNPSKTLIDNYDKDAVISFAKDPRTGTMVSTCRIIVRGKKRLPAEEVFPFEGIDRDKKYGEISKLAKKKDMKLPKKFGHKMLRYVFDVAKNLYLDFLILISRSELKEYYRQVGIVMDDDEIVPEGCSYSDWVKLNPGTFLLSNNM